MTGMNYNDLEKKYLPKDELVDMFTEYYGDENRNLIETKIKKDLKIVFVVESDLVQMDIKKAFQKVYKDNPSIDIDKEADLFIGYLKEFAREGQIISELFFAKHARVLTELGFDMRQILKVNPQTRLPEMMNIKETEKLKDYMNFAVKDTKQTSYKVDFKNIIDNYNRCSQIKKLPEDFVVSYSSYDKSIKTYPDIYGKTTSYEDLKCDFPTIDIKKIGKKDEEILSALLHAKGPASLWKDDYAKFVLEGVNRIFKQNYKSVEEMCSDSKISFFFDYVFTVGNKVSHVITDINVDKKQYISDNASAVNYDKAANHFVMSTNAAAITDSKDQYIAIPVRERSNSHNTAHEINHFIAIDTKGDTGFSKHSNGFNEIVNEFLTKRAMENYKKNHPNSKFEDDGRCSYDNGIKIMNKFLMKFEKILKQCQMQNARNQGVDCNSLLEQFIGKANFKNLMNYSSYLDDKGYNYGNFNIGVKVGDRIEPGTAEEWIEIYKEDPSIALQTPEKDLEKLENLMALEHLAEQLVANFEEFEKGNIVNINPKGYLREAENVNESDLKKDYE